MAEGEGCFLQTMNLGCGCVWFMLAMIALAVVILFVGVASSS